ncbi:MAG TPA: hypothetical protein VGG06_21485 [Thermoanaerobaculia bacterium]|jgi:hypothetical protein
MTLAELIDRHLRNLRCENDRTQEPLKDVEEPREGLATLLGRWEDGDELADEVDRIVASRSGNTRPVPEFEV